MKVGLVIWTTFLVSMVVLQPVSAQSDTILLQSIVEPSCKLPRFRERVRLKAIELDGTRQEVADVIVECNTQLIDITLSSKFGALKNKRNDELAQFSARLRFGRGQNANMPRNRDARESFTTTGINPGNGEGVLSIRPRNIAGSAGNYVDVIVVEVSPSIN